MSQSLLLGSPQSGTAPVEIAPTAPLQPPFASASPRSAQGGFTILEIMIALGILAMLVAVAMSNLNGIFGDSQVHVAKLFVTTEVEVPLTSYRIDVGDFPTSEDGGLNALWVAPANKADRWRGPYAKGNKAPLDPWKREYKYAYPGVHNKNGYDIWSTGKDGVDGGPDNIGNW